MESPRVFSCKPLIYNFSPGQPVHQQPHFPHERIFKLSGAWVFYFMGWSLPGRANWALEMHMRRKGQVVAGIRPAVLHGKIQCVSSSCKHLLDNATPSFYSAIRIQWCLVARHLTSSHCGTPRVATAHFASPVRTCAMAQL